MFDLEEYTSEALLDAVLNNAPDGIDTRPGSIFYDAVAAIVDMIAKFYSDLELLTEMTAVDTATDEALTLKATDYGLSRRAAVSARYAVTLEGGAELETGDRFYTDGVYFVLGQDSSGSYYLEAEEAGEAGNGIESGTPAVPVEDEDDLESATFGALLISGSDEEADENLRTRIKEKISGPAENGNRQQYKTWCESISGVGRAIIYPLWNGPNTVKGVLFDYNGQPCTAATVSVVQTYIDPATRGYTATVDGKTYTVGDGTGDGAAAIGAHFTAVSAQSLPINIAADVWVSSGATQDQAEEEISTAVSKYLKNLIFGSSEHEDMVIRVSSIGACISSCPSVLDYTNLTLNGAAQNITPGPDDAAVTGEVSINVL